MEAFATVKQPRFFNGDSLENSEAKPAGKSHNGMLKIYGDRGRII